MATVAALFIAAPASGQGKTTVTAGLAWYYRSLGKRVRIFKTGPDFIDPMVHEIASGYPVYQLDLWMAGEAHCRQLLADASEVCDVILIEGVMGLFDGAPSSADLARLLNVPVLAVIDASAMAQTFGALAHGLATYQEALPVFGILANRVGSDIHAEMIAGSVRSDTPLLGVIKRDAAANLPERHLGLVQANELSDIEQRIAAMGAQIQLTALSDFDRLPKVDFPNTCCQPIPTLLQGKTIAIAKDAAFSFLYPANIDCLVQLGATVCYFSPLANDELPNCDAIYLPGGYPELYLTALAAANKTKQTLSKHVALGKPLLAECGGMLALLETLTDKQGETASMWSLLPGDAVMQPRFVALGMQAVDLGNGALHGHTFHYSKLNTPLSPIANGVNPHGKGASEAVYQLGSITASYVHSYFPSNPVTIAKLLS